ncbi:MAG: twin-arginine translocation signal domain-containing protein [Anaerolineales bacterium]|nr:MAG: twin-arginine translocation signal domain-containing protein [Anaerolineales bacterium]
MKLSRRDFLKLSGATTGSLLLPGGLALAAKGKTFPLHKPIGETPTICCFCAVGCGAIVASQNGKVVNLEGDPDHPINQGTLCSKGQALAQINLDVGNKRLRKPLYRAAGASEWEEISWEEAIEGIARKIKETRDKYFTVQDDEGRTVNRLEAIASLGGAALDNEECSLIVKAMRALGMVYIEHQARI